MDRWHMDKEQQGRWAGNAQVSWDELSRQSQDSRLSPVTSFQHGRNNHTKLNKKNLDNLLLVLGLSKDSR